MIVLAFLISMVIAPIVGLMVSIPLHSIFVRPVGMVMASLPVGRGAIKGGASPKQQIAHRQYDQRNFIHVFCNLQVKLKGQILSNCLVETKGMLVKRGFCSCNLPCKMHHWPAFSVVGQWGHDAHGGKKNVIFWQNMASCVGASTRSGLAIGLGRCYCWGQKPARKAACFPSSRRGLYRQHNQSCKPG